MRVQIDSDSNYRSYPSYPVDSIHYKWFDNITDIQLKASKSTCLISFAHLTVSEIQSENHEFTLILCHSFSLNGGRFSVDS